MSAYQHTQGVKAKTIRRIPGSRNLKTRVTIAAGEEFKTPERNMYRNSSTENMMRAVERRGPNQEETETDDGPKPADTTVPEPEVAESMVRTTYQSMMRGHPVYIPAAGLVWVYYPVYVLRPAVGNI